MPQISQHRFSVHREAVGRFVVKSDTSHMRLGVDPTELRAVARALRNAAALSKAKGCQVVVEIQNPAGGWKRGWVIEPPIADRSPAMTFTYAAHSSVPAAAAITP